MGDIIKKLFAAEQSGTDSTNGQQRGCGEYGHSHNCDCKAKWILHRRIYKNFDKVGCMIVLDSGEGPQMPWEADMYIPAIQISISRAAVQSSTVIHKESQSGEDIPNPFPNGLPEPTSSEQIIAHLHRDGHIVASNGYVMARVFPTGDVLLPDWTPWATKYGSQTVYFRRTANTDSTDSFDAVIYSGSSVLENQYEGVITFTPSKMTAIWTMSACAIWMAIP